MAPRTKPDVTPPIPELDDLLANPDQHAESLSELAELIKASMDLAKPPTSATPATEWAAMAEGEMLRLPGSGKWARLKKVPILAMIAFAGKAPNKLADEVLRFNAISANRNANEQQQVEEYKKNSRAFLRMAEMVFVEPRLVIDREPDFTAGEIGPFQLYDVDIMWIYFTFLKGEDHELDPFRAPRKRALL